MTNFGVTQPVEPVWTVSQLNHQVASLLQSQFSQIWVRGEISNFTQAASGHWYFSIKDGGAMVRAVMFRSRAQASGITPKVGDQFEFRASVTLYEARGDYQLQVESLRRAGRGDLHEAFLALKEKLAAEGLFNTESKRVPATMPNAIGVVTSLAAAALRDVVTTLRRRAPHIPVIIYPAPVQGPDAAPQLVQAVRTAIARNEVDTLLLVRGGGSIEDLWSFNDEKLARTVAASPIPVICGVGHETDFTICDFVADIRAPTPTAAAELVCQSRQESLDIVLGLRSRLNAAMQRVIEQRAMRLDRVVAGLISPQQRLQHQRDRLQALQDRLIREGAILPQRERNRLLLSATRLSHCVPTVRQHQDRLDRLLPRLSSGILQTLEQKRRRSHMADQTLQALSPAHVLTRGYAIVRNADQEVIKNALDLRVGETLSVEFDRGAAHVKVLTTHGLL